MISSREEEGNGDLCLIQFRPTAAPLSSVLYFASPGDSELTEFKKKFSKRSQHLSWYLGSRQDRFNPLAGVKSDIANNKQG